MNLQGDKEVGRDWKKITQLAAGLRGKRHGRMGDMKPSKPHKSNNEPNVHKE
jgi:hypothetical protein